MRLTQLLLLFCSLQMVAYTREHLRPVPLRDEEPDEAFQILKRKMFVPDDKPTITSTAAPTNHKDLVDSDSFKLPENPDRHLSYHVWIYMETSSTTTTTTTTTLFPPPAHRHASVVRELLQPSEDAVRRCIVRYSVSELTHGERKCLINGLVSVTVDTWEDRVEFISRSEDQRPKPRAIKQKLVRWMENLILGSQEQYGRQYRIPLGCYHHPAKARAVYTDEKENGRITAITVRFIPETTTVYQPSPIAQLPLLPHPSHFGRNTLKHLGYCIFAAAFVTPVVSNSLSLAVSQRTMEIRGRKEGSTELILLSKTAVGCSCMPTQADLVSWWVQHEDTLYPNVIVHIGREDEQTPSSLGCAKSHLAYVEAKEVYQP